ncbi:hypothetical protein IB238_10565 [Rhizobium sp. ARZ01]|uniref:hypothetical protein n=1 Tax=Rhizobium sp. ARZ01 TaxID=2769313 RepID=UPI0017815C55|nr:hypothetical protein [Rhizobium sp. ARZ01]MBD9373062.1 hypothetical protein [Rhizobium sp. ARZ01]
MPSAYLNCTEFLSPEELAQLQRVFDDICLHEQVDDRSALADEVAKQLIRLYQGGVHDSAEIAAIMEHRFHRH